MNKYHRKQDLRIAKFKFAHVDKWVSNEQINQYFSNHLWKASSIFDAQITQTSDMGNYQNICPKHLFTKRTSYGH